MQFPKSLHAKGWQARRPIQQALPGRDASQERSWSQPAGRHFHGLALVTAAAVLSAGVGLDLVDDPRPLDVQLSGALHQAGDTLNDWQGQLSRGLQVSLRAVADGQDTLKADPAETRPRAATVVAEAAPGVVDISDHHQPVRADLAPRLQQTSAIDR